MNYGYDYGMGARYPRFARHAIFVWIHCPILDGRNCVTLERSQSLTSIAVHLIWMTHDMSIGLTNCRRVNRRKGGASDRLVGCKIVDGNDIRDSFFTGGKMRSLFG